MPMKTIDNPEKIKQLAGSAIFLALMLFAVSVFSQNTDRNYIKQTDLLVEEDSISDIGLLQDGEKLVTIQYFDGLGRLIQSNNYHQSSYRNDIIQHIEYDEAGRQKFSYLPFSNNSEGNYDSDAYNHLQQFYSSSSSDPTVPITGVPFGETEFDDSPLNRIMKQGYPGESWQLGKHPQQFDYSSNQSDNIILFEVNEQTLQFQGQGFYDDHSLYVTRTLDENNNPSATYKDKQGRVVVQESEISGTKLRTYYLYNSFGNLAVVISPEGSKLINSSFNSTSEFIQKWCYTYEYDQRQRLIEKRIPGMTSPVCYIYDRLDRVILTQDGNLNQSNKWLFTKYDIYGRLVMEGKYWNNQYTSRSALQDYVVATENSYSLYESRSPEYYTLFFGYTMLAFPPAFGSEILKVYYYDNYDFNSNGSDDYSYHPVPGFNDLGWCPDVRSLPTGNRVKMLGDTIPGDPWLISVSFYDSRLRIIQQQSRNHLSGYDTITTRYNFAGDVILKKHSHSVVNIDRYSISIKVLRDSLIYDHARRLKEHWLKVNSQPYFMMTKMNYNELGQLIEKNLCNPLDTLQSVDYRYTIRGWLQSINTVSNGNDDDDAYEQELLYDGYVNLQEHEAQYNGNISAIRWKSEGMSSWRGYAFFYDELNRLIQAAYREPLNWYFQGPETYSVPVVEYDANGNIQRLQRKGLNSNNQVILIDDLNYYYENNSNQLTGVNEYQGSGWNYGFQEDGHWGTPEYFYDANGNMIRDDNKGIIDITYNHLNLPEIIRFENNRRIKYLYDANGVKLQKLYYDERGLLITTTDYSGEFVYTNESTDYILTSEGRMKRNESGTYFYPEYFLTDHLGNVRVVVSGETSQPVVKQVTDYYPFGMEIEVTRNSDNQLKYNAKELQTDADLDWYDYGARFYDPLIGRFHVPDAFAEKYSDLSPYQYGANNPVLYIDVNGDSLWINYQGNNILYENGSLYNKDGTAYSGEGVKKNGKLKGFLRSSVSALSTIGSTDAGSAMISGLQSSENNFTIMHASMNPNGNGNEFIASDHTKAYANQLRTDPAQATSYAALQSMGVDINGGSGGAIYWDPSGNPLPTTSGVGINAATDLAHEMFHGMDANQGALDSRIYLHPKITRSEWSAVYGENTVRGQLGVPLRTHYITIKDPSGNVLGGTGPRMITPINTPILPIYPMILKPAGSIR
jgi:RHS repeat-associated protein